MKLWPQILVLMVPLAVATACTADKAGDGQQPDKDASVEQVLGQVQLSNVVELTPRDAVAIRGTSGGSRVVILGGTSGTVVTSILPGGAFCAQVDIADGATTDLSVVATGQGLLSEPLVVAVTQDSSAPDPPQPTCSGNEGTECAATEICDNEVDDNCDGYTDVCDSGCNTCIDDALEPNDFVVNVPQLGSGQYSLMLCPCRDDWFAFSATAGQSIRATVDFVDADSDIDLALYMATPEGKQGDRKAGSTSVTDHESIDFAVTEDGLYYLRIYVFGSNGTGQGAYQLTIP